MNKEIVDIKKTVQEILAKIQIDGKVAVIDEDDFIKINITNVPEADLLTDYNGEGLKALQYIIKIILFRQYPDLTKRIMVDIDSYFAKKEDLLKDLALKAAERVKKSKNPETLAPMTSYERRIVHMALALKKGILTESVGDGPMRRIVIRLK